MLIFLTLKKGEIKLIQLIIMHICFLLIQVNFIILLKIEVKLKLSESNKIIKEQNEKIKLLESELNEIEMQELDEYIERRDENSM